MDSVPLCEAARKCNAPLIQKLLEHGAQVNFLERGHSARWFVKTWRKKELMTGRSLASQKPTEMLYKEVDKLLKKRGGKII